MTTLRAGQWTSLGPDGGDVRSLNFDPKNPDRIYLGTSTGTLFLSNDAGHSWSRLAHLGGDDNVLDHITIDPQNPKHIYVSAWSVENQQAGDIYRTHDGGNNWEALSDMHGKSVRAMAISASDSKILVAGALDGVYRSKNGGNSWERISPPSAEIKNIESIAIDPKNPDVVYAGTWHLAWKTADGGASWQHINKGMIDDSDVFSVIVDSTNSSVVYASACSGIYKSESAGDLFHKLQGIPFSARRTRVLKQDPNSPATVYAGTTEGLWKTIDGGKTWKHVTNSEVVVNDVLVDPRNSDRVLLATDRSGVMASDNGAATFTASNHGYTHRYVSSILADQKDPNAILVGVVNDREWGGVFSTRNGGQSWQQKSAGLGGRDVFALQQASNGALIAGTNKGMFLLDRNSSQWRPINTIVTEKTPARMVKNKKTKKTVKLPGVMTRSVLDARVSDIEVTPKRWLAATSAGLFSSTDEGKTWTGGAVLGKTDFVSVESEGELVVAATRTNVLYSKNAGATWQQAPLSAYVTSIHGVTLTPGGDILLASREGAFRSSDSGATWEHVVNGIPDKNISSIAYDQGRNRLLATSSATGVVFESKDSGRTWHRGPDSGYPLRRISVVRGRFVGATPFDGVIVQPENEAESASAGFGSSSN
ncbi:MAG TPA: transcriptional regulator [Terriglobales bacterium]|nr:transcriptional regulator [Terriglobales bacterium]